MNRNHPYFKSMSPTLLPTASKQVTTPAHVPMAPEYVPLTACVDHPMWMYKDQQIQYLHDIFAGNMYNPNMGYEIDGRGFIYNANSNTEASGGFISAQAFDLSKDGKVRYAPVTIINTEDAGLRYACCDNDGFTADIGPVESVCIVGNYERPEGLYVPMCNTKAMADGMEILKEMINLATKDDKDLLPFEKDEEISVNHPTIANGKLCAIDFGPDGVDIPEEVEMALLEAQRTGVYPTKNNCACGVNCKCKKDKKK